MSEASSAVLFRHELSDLDLAWVRELLSERATASGGAVRLSASAEDYRIDGVSIAPVFRRQYPTELGKILGTGLSEVLGWMPLGILGLVSGGGDAHAHRVMGGLCLAVAERWDGIVAFGGPIPLQIAGTDSSPEFVLPRRIQNPDGLTGNLYVAGYGTSRTLLCHYGDAAFLRSWLAHPAYTLG